MSEARKAGDVSEVFGAADSAEIPLARPIVRVEEISPDIPVARPVYPESLWLQPPPDPLLLRDQTRRSAWADLGWFALFAFAVELMIVGVIRAAALLTLGETLDSAEELRPEGRRMMLLPTVMMRAAGWIAAVMIILRRRGKGLSSVGLSAAALPLNVAIGFVIVIVAYGIIAIAMYAIWMLWPGLEDPGENARRIMAFVPKLRPWQFVLLASLIGFYEELVFRGFLMPRLRRALGGWTLAVIVTTLIFTALHSIEQTRAALIVVAILSLLFSVVTIWRRSMAPAVVAHALFDLSQFLFLYWLAGEEWT